MKTRIFGCIIVAVVLGALYALTGGLEQSSSPSMQSQPQSQNSSDADFKSLKIQ